MGRFDCPVHGAAPMGIVCDHIQESIHSREKIDPVTRATFIDHDHPDYGGTRHLFYCKTCSSDYGLPPQNHEFTMDRYSEVYKLGFIPVCWKCFAQLTNL